MEYKTKNLVICIILLIIIICSVVATILFSSNESNNENSDIVEMKNGKYSCEFEYNGKTFDDNETVKAYMNKISSITEVSFDDMDVAEFRSNFDTMGNYYIHLEDGNIDLYLSNGSLEYKYFTYNKKENKIIFNTDSNSEEAKDTLDEVINNIIKIEQNKENIIIKDFGAVFIYPTIYNSHIQKGEDPKNIKYDTYKNVGNLVCNSSTYEEIEEKLDDNEDDEELSIYMSEIEFTANSWNVGIENTLYYALYDINKDGIKELIIKIEPYEGIVSVSTIQNNQIMPLISSCGARCYVNIYDNGTFEQGGSSGACAGQYDIYANINNDESKVTNWEDLGIKVSLSFTCLDDYANHTDTMYYEITLDGKTFHTSMSLSEAQEISMMDYFNLNVQTGKEISKEFKWIKYTK